MAASNRILSLDLGTQTVGMAEFQTDKNGGLVLVDYRSTGLLADPSVDVTRLSQAKMAASELVEAMGCKGLNVNYSVSAQAVFTRFVKLPSLGEEQADQIVAFEAQQNVPFPIDEVVWDYQLMDSGSAEVEVVLVAIKSDLLDEINNAVESSGVLTGVVDISPMAIYNAYRYNYSDQPGCSLIIDVGARTTNLIFVEPKKVFSRTIPIGGTKFTEAIAKDFSEPFGAAEERKKRDGFVSLGGAYADPEDPEVARVSKMIRNSMTRLHSEIGRSISFYRAQQHGMTPARVLLCGGSVALPYMREFFQEKLQLPVEFFNPLRNVAVGSGLDAEQIGRQAHTMGEVVGLALRGVSRCPMELNLRPASVMRRQRLAKQRPFIVMAGVCFLLTLTAWWLYYSHAAAVAEGVAENVTKQLQPLKDVQNRISVMREDIKKQGEVAEPLLSAVTDRTYWVRVIDDINSRLPAEGVWVVSFGVADAKPEPAAAGPERPPTAAAKAGDDKAGQRQLMLKGLYLNGDQAVEDFFTKLSESPYYEAVLPSRKLTKSDGSQYAYDWSIPLTLKNPISSK